MLIKMINYSLENVTSDNTSILLSFSVDVFLYLCAISL